MGKLEDYMAFGIRKVRVLSLTLSSLYDSRWLADQGGCLACTTLESWTAKS